MLDLLIIAISSMLVIGFISYIKKWCRRIFAKKKATAEHSEPR